MSSTLQSIPSVSPALLSARMPAETKAPSAFRTISEVAVNLEVPQHVLRFWESKFQQVRPLKRGGGRRYYRPEDVALLSSIKELLYTQGLTIRGVQKLLKENGRALFVRSTPSGISSSSASLGAPVAVSAQPTQAPCALSADSRRSIEGVLSELKALRELLRQSGV